MLVSVQVFNSVRRLPVDAGRVDVALVRQEHGAAAARPATHDVHVLHVDLHLRTIIANIQFLV